MTSPKLLVRFHQMTMFAGKITISVGTYHVKWHVFLLVQSALTMWVPPSDVSWFVNPSK